MEEIDVITLEDGNDYMITDEKVINNVRYVYLIDEKNIINMAVRKINIVNNKECLVGLDSKEELTMALKEFLNH